MIPAFAVVRNARTAAIPSAMPPARPMKTDAPSENRADRLRADRQDDLGEGRYSHKSESALQGEGEPVEQAGHRSDSRTHAARDEEVVPARSRHCAGQLCHAQQAGCGKQSCHEVRHHNRRSGLGVGKSRQDEQTRTDHRARRDAEDVAQSEVSLQRHGDIRCPRGGSATLRL